MSAHVLPRGNSVYSPMFAQLQQTILIDDMTTAEHLGRVCLRRLFFGDGTGEDGVISAAGREWDLHLLMIRGNEC